MLLTVYVTAQKEQRSLKQYQKERDFSYLVITGETDAPISPCGACRQVIAEFCEPKMQVLLTNVKGDEKEVTVEQLLPGAFSIEDLK